MQRSSKYFQYIFVSDFYDAKSGFTHPWTYKAEEDAREAEDLLSWRTKNDNWVKVPKNVVTLCHVVSEKTYMAVEDSEAWTNLTKKEKEDEKTAG